MAEDSVSGCQSSRLSSSNHLEKPSTGLPGQLDMVAFLTATVVVEIPENGPPFLHPPPPFVQNKSQKSKIRLLRQIVYAARFSPQIQNLVIPIPTISIYQNRSISIFFQMSGPDILPIHPTMGCPYWPLLGG